MILVAALLVGVGGVLVIVGVNAGSLVWLHGAIAAATSSLLALGVGVARALRRPGAAGDADAVGGHADGTDHGPEPRQPDEPG